MIFDGVISPSGEPLGDQSPFIADSSYTFIYFLCASMMA